MDVHDAAVTLNRRNKVVCTVDLLAVTDTLPGVVRSVTLFIIYYLLLFIIYQGKGKYKLPEVDYRRCRAVSPPLR